MRVKSKGYLRLVSIVFISPPSIASQIFKTLHFRSKHIFFHVKFIVLLTWFKSFSLSYRHWILVFTVSSNYWIPDTNLGLFWVCNWVLLFSRSQLLKVCIWGVKKRRFISIMMQNSLGWFDPSSLNNATSSDWGSVSLSSAWIYYRLKQLCC